MHGFPSITSLSSAADCDAKRQHYTEDTQTLSNSESLGREFTSAERCSTLTRQCLAVGVYDHLAARLDDTKLHEMQDMQTHERRLLLDRIFSQGAIVSWLAGTVDGDDVTIADGVVYADGHAVNVPGASLSFPGGGEHTIYVDVFRRVVTASDDPSLVSPLTGEPTAEREKWIATLQGRDTSGDPLPDGAISRTVVPVYIFNRTTGDLTPSAPLGSNIAATLADHEERIADVEDGLVAGAGALDTHKTSADHDGRYFTETESDGRFAPLGHVGAAGDAHALADESQAGFLASETFGFLSGLIRWNGTYDYGGQGTALLPYDVLSGPKGMSWKRTCDGGYYHRLAAVLRAKSAPVTLVIELYHITGQVTILTGSRVQRVDTQNDPPTVPGGHRYEILLYPDSFTEVVITATAGGDTGFSLAVTSGSDDFVCYDLDPNRAGKSVVSE